MILLLKPGRLPAQHWIDAFAAKMPELEVRLWPDVGDRAEVDVLFTVRIAEGEVARFPNLKFVALIAAGADRLLADPDIPPHTSHRAFHQPGNGVDHEGLGRLPSRPPPPGDGAI